MPNTIVVAGDGAWGTAIALLLARSPENQVRLWSAREENAAILREQRENVRLLPGIRIPEQVDLATDPACAGDADLLVEAIPTVYLRATLARFKGVIRPELPVVSLTKGIENSTFMRPTEIIQSVLGSERVACLSGPSHAEEVSRGMPTSVVVASADANLALRAQQLFLTERFRVYTSSDVIGIELAGALKNIIGIGAGISDGLGFGDNAKSALLSRGLVEMARFGVAFGAEHATFQGLAGMGDLITTCISPHGRNRRVGYRLGKGEKLADIQASTPMVAEGVTTARSVFERTRQMGLDMPVMTAIYRVLYEEKPPFEAVDELMARLPRAERVH
jgi:glycerol-3-phosphate dehydrogenase (NAD(P)+)